tara:strand:+ start:4456 stop:4923 length:468 start_codon:yes stop_codon:yes gene_type:complete
MVKNKILSFILFTITTFSASFIGGLVTINFKEPWYSTLYKPNYNPPDWIFGPVWTVLYLFMVISIWNAWHKNTNNLNLVFIYFIHLFFNTTWSIVFFGFNNIFLAMLNLVVLIIFIVLLILKYKNISLLSMYLMFPYLLWCCFALFLNINIYLIN